MTKYILWIYILGSPKAQSYTIKQAKALAMTAIDVMCSPDLMAQVKQGFQQDLLSQKAWLGKYRWYLINTDGASQIWSVKMSFTCLCVL